MKKNVPLINLGRAGSILLAACCLAILPASAQNRVMAPGKLVKAKKIVAPTEPKVQTFTNKTAKPAPVRKSTPGSGNQIATATKVDIATSANIYGSLVAEGTLGAYNPTLDVISYTNRKAIGNTFPVNNSGVIQTHVSYDKGLTWDTTLAITQNATDPNRYPNGVVANPPGNTTPNQGYAVASAPIIVGGATWDGGTFASLRLDNQNASQLNIYNASAPVTPQYMPRLGMCTGTNGNVYVLGSNYDFNNTTNPYFDGAVINKGVWDAANNNYTWTQTLIYHAFSQDPADGSQNFSSLGTIAFSQDGVTGYLVLIGRDSINDHQAPMPIVYRTTDAGATWSLYYTGDFSPLFQGFFPASSAANPAVDRPFWNLQNSLDAQVDANGKIHILCEVSAAYSNDADSLNFLNSYGTVFDVYEDNSGNWNALWVGTVLTDPEDGTNLNWAVGTDARLQITRSADATKMGYFWMDTDTLIAATNAYPNIIGVAADFTTQTYTNEINFTAGGNYDGSNYWLYVAGDSWAANGNFVVPGMTSRSIGATGTDTEPWMHEFVGGLEFTSNDFTNPFITSLNELPNNLNTIVLYPNPTASLSNLMLDLKSGSNVMVNVVNSLGQTISSQNFGFRAAGSNNLQLDLSEVSSGLYIIQVMIGNEWTSKVLSVQK